MDKVIFLQNFIDQIWNNRDFTALDNFLHKDFKDHSLPPAFPPNLAGTKEWIMTTSTSFEHQTIIEQQVTESDNCIIKIKMNLKHIGTWRKIEPTGIMLSATGYRQFKFKDGKIIEHWSLIDGQAIENELKNASHGCKSTK